MLSLSFFISFVSEVAYVSETHTQAGRTRANESRSLVP